MDPERPRTRWDITIGGVLLLLFAMYVYNPNQFGAHVKGLLLGLSILLFVSFLYLAGQFLIVRIVASAFKRPKQMDRQQLRESFKSFDFFKRVVRHLQYIGQIKETATDEELKELWERKESPLP